MNKIKRSVKLLQAAFNVLLREKKLFLFPVIATVLALVIALFFIAPVALYPTGHSYFPPRIGARWRIGWDTASTQFNCSKTSSHTSGR